jgi:chromosome segregation ATPase
MTVSPDQTASLKSVLAAAEGDVEELERLIEEGEGAFASDEVSEACRRLLLRRQNVDVMDSVVNRSRVECSNVVKIYHIINRKQKPDTRLKALKEGLHPLVNSLTRLKGELERLKEIAGEIPGEFRQAGSGTLASLLSRHRQLSRETDQLRHQERELESQIEFYKDAGLEWE